MRESRVLTLFCGAPRCKVEEHPRSPHHQATELRQKLATGECVDIVARAGALAQNLRHVETARRAGYRIEIDFRGPTNNERPTPQIMRDLNDLPSVAAVADKITLRAEDKQIAVIEDGNAQMLATVPKWLALGVRIAEGDRCSPEIGRVLVQVLAKQHGLGLEI